MNLWGINLDQQILEWLHLLSRWLHITAGVSWIGSSIFFMWLDRTLKKNLDSQTPGHIGDLWMVHGGGFYRVEKLQMGPVKVPEPLHWFKWESYWTWMSGIFLLILIFYTGNGTFLLDTGVASITYGQGAAIGIFSLLGSWFFYDFLWERTVTKNTPLIGHIFTIAWLSIMAYALCRLLSGRAAYIHIGAMLGTWMTGNVFMRIIPRQVKMVEAAKRGEPANIEWGKNAKNRSTHNTYFTLPVIFIMLSNHFPSTYGHEANWLVLLAICAAGAAIREYFVKRIDNPKRAIAFGLTGILILAIVIGLTYQSNYLENAHQQIQNTFTSDDSKGTINTESPITSNLNSDQAIITISGTISYEGNPPAPKPLSLPDGCLVSTKGPAFANDVLIKNGKIQNVLVRIVKGLEGKTFSDIPHDEVMLDQLECQYVPRVIAARVGQKVTFINSDNLFHNIRSISQNNKNFNMAMPQKNQRITMVFDKPEIFLQSKCSLHPWMGAFIAIMDHPYFSITNEKGEFKIFNLPAGTYTLEAWHEVFGTITKELTLTDRDSISLDFNFR
jgi:uncharacterized membrane protein/plastocyanin